MWKLVCRLSAGEVQFHEESDEGRPTVEFGWCCGGSFTGGVSRTLRKVKRWRSPGFNSIVEVQMESNSCRSLKSDRLL